MSRPVPDIEQVYLVKKEGRQGEVDGCTDEWVIVAGNLLPVFLNTGRYLNNFIENVIIPKWNTFVV